MMNRICWHVVMWWPFNVLLTLPTWMIARAICHANPVNQDEA